MSDRFAIVKRGYDINEVDAYVETMESVIKSYKDKDAAIKNAILSAQIAGDNIITSARNRSVIIKEQSVKKISDIIGSIETQRAKLTAFKEDYGQLAKKYLGDNPEADIAAIFEQIDGLQKFLERFTDDEEQDATTPAQ